MAQASQPSPLGPGVTPAEGQVLLGGQPATYEEMLAVTALWRMLQSCTPERTTSASSRGSGDSNKTNAAESTGPRSLPSSGSSPAADVAAVAAPGPASLAATSSSAPAPPPPTTGPHGAPRPRAARRSGNRPTRNEAEQATALGWMGSGSGVRRSTPCTCCAARQAKIARGAAAQKGDVFLPCTDRIGGMSGNVRSNVPKPGQVSPCARCKALHMTCIDPDRERQDREEIEEEE